MGFLYGVYRRRKRAVRARLLRGVQRGLPRGLRFEYRYGASVLRQEVSLCEGSAVLRFDTDVDWQETKKMLRADFYPEVYADEVTCDIQFGSLKRTMKENNSHEWAQYEICAHKWADMSERGYGVALLNDCKYGLRAKKGLLSLDLLRSQTYPLCRPGQGRAHLHLCAVPARGRRLCGRRGEGGIRAEQAAAHSARHARAEPRLREQRTRRDRNGQARL